MEVCPYSRQVAQDLTLWLPGTIGGETDPPANVRSNGPLEIIITPPAPLFIPSEVENETTIRTASSELQPPSLPEYPLLCSPGCDWDPAQDTASTVMSCFPDY